MPKLSKKSKDVVVRFVDVEFYIVVEDDNSYMGPDGPVLSDKLMKIWKESFPNDEIDTIDGNDNGSHI